MTFVEECLILQIFAMAAGITATVVILGIIRPFEDPSRTAFEYFNEIVAYLVLYHMLVFTPFASEPIARTCLGYSCAIILSIHLLVHLFSILRTNLSFVKFKLQLCYARSKLQDEVTGHPALMEQRRKRKNKLGGVNSKLKLNNFDKFEKYDHDLEAAIQNVLVPVVEVRNSRKKKQKQAISPLEALVEVDEKDQSPDIDRKSVV